MEETRETLSNYRFVKVDKNDAKEMILKNHYSHKWQNVFGQHNYGIISGGELLGVVVYGYMMNPNSYKSIANLNKEQVIELNRLWIDDRLGKNTETMLMKYAHRELLEHTPVRLVQSFADGRLGVGTIYQAMNFGYYGKSKTLFHKNIVDGEILHGAKFSDTSSLGMIERNAMHARRELTTFTVNTYRYLKPLTKAAARRIKLKQQPYPKERLGITGMDNYIPPTGQVVRACLLAHIKNTEPQKQQLTQYIRELGATPEDVRTQATNTFVHKWANKNQANMNEIEQHLLEVIKQ